MNFRIILMVSLLLWSTASLSNETNVSVADNITVVDDTELAFPESESELEQDAEYTAWSQSLLDSLTLRVGAIAITDINVALNVPDTFYYLDPEDAEKVLVDVWGNPPGSQTLGMLLPAGMTPFDDDVWAVTVEYIEDGYVSDQDAATIDYSALLQLMQQDMQADNEQRVQEGFEPLSLLGWAVEPVYDTAANKMHWAQEIKFGDEAVNALNYNIRVLGRRGVLLLNFIAGMDQREQITKQLEEVLSIAGFAEGSQYADFNSGSDELAGYGLTALIAGDVVSPESGLSTILVGLKKFAWFILLGFCAVFALIFFIKRKR